MILDSLNLLNLLTNSRYYQLTHYFSSFNETLEYHFNPCVARGFFCLPFPTFYFLFFLPTFAYLLLFCLPFLF